MTTTTQTTTTTPTPPPARTRTSMTRTVIRLRGNARDLGRHTGASIEEFEIDPSTIIGWGKARYEELDPLPFWPRLWRRITTGLSDRPTLFVTRVYLSTGHTIDTLSTVEYIVDVMGKEVQRQEELANAND